MRHYHPQGFLINTYIARLYDVVGVSNRCVYIESWTLLGLNVDGVGAMLLFGTRGETFEVDKCTVNINSSALLGDRG